MFQTFQFNWYSLLCLLTMPSYTDLRSASCYKLLKQLGHHVAYSSSVDIVDPQRTSQVTWSMHLPCSWSKVWISEKWHTTKYYNKTGWFVDRVFLALSLLKKKKKKTSQGHRNRNAWLLAMLSPGADEELLVLLWISGVTGLTESDNFPGKKKENHDIPNVKPWF